MSVREWLENAKKSKKTMPILSFPGVQLVGASVDEMVRSGRLQADCMKAIADRYDTLASVSLMDLSVEAEAFGSPIQFSADEVPTVTGRILITEEDVDRLAVPEVGAGRTGEYVKALQYAVEDIQDRPIFAGIIGPFSLAGRLMDMTEIMINCYEEPEMVHKALEKATEFLIKYAKAFKATGCNGIVIAEPAAGLLSPDLIAEFSSPYVKRIVEALDDEAFLVIYHNCGKTIPLVESILSTGARVLHFGNAISMAEMMPHIPNDVMAMGNIDPSSVFRNGTPEAMKAAVEKLLKECNHYSNFIISSGCDIPPMTPLANIDAYFKACNA